MATLFVDKLDPQSGTALEIGSSGDTITIPSGATITNSGTATNFGETLKPAFHANNTSNPTWTINTHTKIAFTNENLIPIQHMIQAPQDLQYPLERVENIILVAQFNYMELTIFMNCLQEYM